MKSGRFESLKLALILFWLIFTVAFAIWWFKFSLEHIATLASLQPENAAHWQRQQRMVVWEGTTWLVLLVLGGAALIALVQKEKLRVRRIREFFASFSHEVKTSLASLRVQAEALQDEMGENSSPILTRLVGDTVRLQLQLENSLFLASQDNLKLFVQPVELESLLERMREQWPTLTITTQGHCTLRGDERALRTVFSNLVQNAHVHGKARNIAVKAETIDGERVRVIFSDDGKGFHGDVTALGELFHRPQSTSGSGLGLHICRLLLNHMGGDIELKPQHKGFSASLTLEGARA